MASSIPTVVHGLRDVESALRAVKAELNLALGFEGSWTPTLFGSSTAGTNTYVQQAGRYMKRGTLVHFRTIIVMSAKDGAMSGSIRVSLPFTSANNVANSSVAISRYTAIDLDVAGGYYQLGGIIDLNASYVELYQSGDNVTYQAINHGSIAATTRIYMSGWYIAAA